MSVDFFSKTITYITKDYILFKVKKGNRDIIKKAKYRKLRNSIIKDGQVVPIEVFESEDGYYIIDHGQHRAQILEEANMPIKFVIIEESDNSKKIQVDSLGISYGLDSFASMGKNRDIAVFQLIYRIFNSSECKLNFTSILETVLTFLVNDCKSVFSNGRFLTECKNDVDIALESYNKVITDEHINKLDEFFQLLDEFYYLLNMRKKAKLRVNFVKEFLKFHISSDTNSIDSKELLKYLKAENSLNKYLVELKINHANLEIKKTLFNIVNDIENIKRTR